MKPEPTPPAPPQPAATTGSAGEWVDERALLEEGEDWAFQYLPIDDAVDLAARCDAAEAKLADAEAGYNTYGSKCKELQAQLAAAQAELAKLQDPVATTINLLNGKIAWSREGLIRVLGEDEEVDKLRAELTEARRQLDAARGEAKAYREALERLDRAAECYCADQKGATDDRCGITQPITVAEGIELSAAINHARAALEKYNKPQP